MFIVEHCYCLAELLLLNQFYSISAIFIQRILLFKLSAAIINLDYLTIKNSPQIVISWS